MANEIVNSSISTDQEKFLAARLIQRSLLKLVCASVCDPIQQPEGAGLTAYFVRYQRMNVPLAPLTEAVVPPNNTFSLQQVTVTLDQWGDVLTLSDIAQLTAKHPLMQQAIELLSDNAQRVIDREIQTIWLSGTNVTYGDSTVTTRALVTSAMRITDTIIHRARISLVNGGAPPRGGPAGGVVLGNVGGTLGAGKGPTKGSGLEGIGGADAASITQGQAFVGITDPNVIGDIMQAGTSLGTWASVAMYANQKALYNAEQGTWLGIRWVETNFIPLFQLLGDATIANVSGTDFGTNTPVVTANTTGGVLATGTYYYAVTRKDLTRGFEEFISIAHSTAATGATASFTFDFTGLTAGYAYNVYFDATGGGGSGADSAIKLVAQNVSVGTIVTVTNVGTGAVKPATPTLVNVHVVYLHGAESCNWVSLQNLQVFLSFNQPTTDNPIMQFRKVGYKFMGKTMIRDQLRMLRLELASTY